MKYQLMDLAYRDPGILNLRVYKDLITCCHEKKGHHKVTIIYKGRMVYYRICDGKRHVNDEMWEKIYRAFYLDAGTYLEVAM